MASDYNFLEVENSNCVCDNLTTINTNLTPVTRTVWSGVVTAPGGGASPLPSRGVTYILSSDFSGTVNGIAGIPGSIMEFSASGLDGLNAIPYVVNAGTLTFHIIF